MTKETRLLSDFTLIAYKLFFLIVLTFSLCGGNELLLIKASSVVLIRCRPININIICCPERHKNKLEFIMHTIQCLNAIL